ncbi:hypothetical protein [Olleya sp. Bg11-27]|uniref:hypothetical protein n=1 Tax=Olleya sp. Bg11-27 TaxID=2058135 RepID=UPI000C3079B0|nr:hypothetical protein [Olleya sp. Bg11-27]AUC74613.1 hypothetical protein CW732_02520 [Olleya sp. Bg11-27]
MKPVNIKTTRQKEVRRLQKRQQEIWKLQRALGYTKLDKPIRHGWYKEIVMTNRIEIYRNKDLILEIYEKLEKAFWAKTKEKAAFKWQHQTSIHLIYKDIPTLSKRQFNKLSDGAKQLCIPFEYYTRKQKLRTRFYTKIPKGSYKIKFTRAYITHRQRIDPEIISETDYIASKLNKKGYYNIAEASNPWKDDWNDSSYKQEQLRTKRGLNELKKYALEDIIKDTILWERN